MCLSGGDEVSLQLGEKPDRGARAGEFIQNAEKVVG